MLILGLNGWPEGGHAASAVLLKDGVPLVMIEEERVSRIKHADNVAPHLSISECLEFAGIGWESIDAVAYGFDMHRLYETVDRQVGQPIEQILLPPDYWAAATQPPLYQVPHHLAHAASAFLCSPFTSATIVVIDGQGEVESTTIWHGDATDIHPLRSFGLHTSLGFFYDTVTELAGFGRKDPGKLMGLAPYGKARPPIRAFKLAEGGYDVPSARGIARSRHARFDQDHPVRDWWKKKLGKYADDGSEPFENHDLAAAAQAALERVLLHLIREAIAMTGDRKVVLAGGVALNCSANGKVQRSGLVEELFIQPAAGDAGVSLGAALYLDWRQHKRWAWTMEHAYLGCQFDDGSTQAAVKEFGYPMKKLDGETLLRTVAGMLDEGRIVAWFQGRAEVGPRALGNRSILADPRDPDMQDRVNLIKGREQWRPLAPSVPTEDFPNFFDGADESPFMLLALPVSREVRATIPSVVHVDGSARPQSVSKEINPKYWALLRAWERQSGVPVLLNTSFNLRGEPIVNSPREALDSFSRSELDAVVIGSTLVTK